MMQSKLIKGKNGENIARRYLEREGMRFIEANYRAMHCEIDLIMKDGETVAFVEVKARSGRNYGTGLEAVTAAKQKNIIRAATAYAASHGLMEMSLRFDAAEVDLNTGAVNYIKNAFVC